jgi:hypothetical protein
MASKPASSKPFAHRGVLQPRSPGGPRCKVCCSEAVHTGAEDSNLSKLVNTPNKPHSASAAGPRCAVCRHPQFHLITTDLAVGMSQRAVARKFGFTQETMRTHANKHMGAKLLEHNLTQPVLDQIRMLNQRTLRILGEAEHGKYRDPTIALQAIREARHNGELIAKLTGELKTSAPTNEPVVVRIEYIDKQLVVESNNQSNTPPPAIETAESA